MDPRIFFSDPIQTETVDPDPTIGSWKRLQNYKNVGTGTIFFLDLH